MQRILVGMMGVGVSLLNLGATPIVPSYDTFGPLPAATFGGSGIPNHAVAVSTYSGVILALTAHQRYFNPTVSNNGAGDFYAVAGGDVYSVPPMPVYGRWNFGFYIKNDSSTIYVVDLLYDSDPGAGTDASQHGILRQRLMGNTLLQDSWNLGMNFLYTPAIWMTGFLTPPSYGSFNPNVGGEYTFALILRDSNLVELDRAAIRVNVRLPDAGGTTGLLFFGLLGLIGLRRTAK
ncbi:MAG: hypothetical protein RMN51_01065 [Verrucomicrobiota bacterium]|nr:hypothetical protein [Limisphaera sp.]MDW8380689.1 hypothetical protein [Verrucomicrobiota bacterium]